MTEKYNQNRGEIKKEWKGTGISDIPSSTQDQIGSRLKILFDHAISKYSTKNIRLKEIIICGSYHNSEAIKYFSDLDIRFVVTEIPDQQSEIQNYFQREYDATENCFGYVDIQCHTDSLPKQYTRIWKE